jgi:phosphate transport system ATP-binding protein
MSRNDSQPTDPDRETEQPTTGEDPADSNEGSNPDEDANLAATSVGRGVTDASDANATRDRRTVIEAEDLDFYYGETQALDDVSIEIPSNCVTAIIGPSGCGKSTFLRCINRMNDLVEIGRIEGTLRFEGHDVYADDVDPVALRRRIGMVFQHPNPFPKSIYDNVAYGLRIQDRTENLDEVVEESLRRAALWDEVSDRLEESALDLSGGQQQRLCIARAIAVDPDVVLMDEPASALDPIATSQIEDLIEDLAETYTVVIVTHNMQQAARISDKTAVFLTGGELVEFDDTDQIFENPQSQRVEDYITGKFG